MARVRAALALCVLLVHGVAWEARAASYKVGDSAGWDISADLPSWLDGKTFNVGDVLGMNLSNISPASLPYRKKPRFATYDLKYFPTVGAYPFVF